MKTIIIFMKLKSESSIRPSVFQSFAKQINNKSGLSNKVINKGNITQQIIKKKNAISK